MFITLGEFNIQSLLFILVPLSIAIRAYLETLIDNKNKNLFFNVFLRFFSRSLNGIFWILFEKSMSFQKKTKNEIESFNQKKFFDYTDSENLKNINQFEIEKQKREKLEIIKLIEVTNKKRINFIILIFLGFLDFVSVNLHILVSELKIYQNISLGLLTLMSCFRIFALAILSSILIQYRKSYSHHYFSEICIGLVGIIILILSFIFEKNQNENFFIKLILMIIPEVCFSFMYSIGLVYLIRTNGNLYKILCINGITGIILSIILQIIMSFCRCDKIEGFIRDFYFCEENHKFRTILYNLKNFSNFNGFIAIGIILVNCFENIFIFLLIYIFSLNHFGASYPISSILLQFILKNNTNNTLKIPYIIGTIIIIFMSLVNSEIIILKFCGFDKNTRKEIKRRSVLDYENTSKEDDDEILHEKKEDKDRLY